MAELVFKSAMNFKSYLKQMILIESLLVILLVVLGITIYTGIEMLIMFLGGFCAMVSIFIILGLIILYFSQRNIAKINRKGLQIPPSGYGGLFFPEQTGDGYFWDMRGKNIIISSSFKNIKNAWVVKDKDEIKSIKTNRAIYRLSLFIGINGVKVRINEIPNLLKSISERDFTKNYMPIIENAFKYSHSNIPEKTVAIKFKKMELWIPGKNELSSMIKNNDVVESIKRVMPILNEPVLYVSVKNPVEFLNEINKRILE